MDKLYIKDAEEPQAFTLTISDTGRFLSLMTNYYKEESVEFRLDVADAEVLAEYLYKWVEKQLEIF